MTVLWLAATLWIAGCVGLCLAQSPSPSPDILGLTQKAQAGDLDAMTALGEAYLDGNGVARDLDAAIGWFARAAQSKDVQALYLMSFALRERARPGDLDQALRYGTAALARAGKRAGSALVEANIQSQLGFTYERLGRFEEAVTAYAEARRIFERILGRNHPQVAGAYMNLASGLAGAGRQEESLAANETALALFAGLTGSDSEMVAGLYENKAISLVSLARYGEALEALDRAMAIFLERGGPDAAGAADVLKTKSRVYSLLGRNGEAAEAAQSALAIYAKRPPDPRTLAATHGMLGLAYQGERRYAEARAEYLAAAGILEGSYGANVIDMMHPLTNLGNVEDDLGHYEAALSDYRKALAVIREAFGADHAEVATMLGRLGNTSRKLARLDDALDYGLEALLIQAGAGNADIDSRRYTFRMLARIFAARGNTSAALLFAKQAVNTHQALRARNGALPGELRATLGESFQPSYRLLAELLLADGQFAETQFVGGLLKQEEFYEFTRGAEKRPAERRDAEPGDVRLTRAEQKLWDGLLGLMTPEHRIAADLRALAAASPDRRRGLAGKRDAAVRTFIAGAAGLIAASEAGRRLRQQETVDSGPRYAGKLQADLKAMGPNVLLLQAMSLEDDLHLFVSAAGRETVHRQVPVSRARLADQVFAAVAAAESRDGEAAAKLAGLYDLLVRPVRADLEAAAARGGANPPVLLLDLSGFLRYVPFAALQDGRRYLIEDFALALYNPAIPTQFASSRRDRARGAGFGVTRALPGFPALPGVRRELAAVFGIVRGTPKLDDGFDENSLARALAAKPQILHIASHFRFRPGNEMNSYLLLGNGDGLSLKQLRTQKRFRFRGIDLITLSACETARGGGAEGEEIESFGALARASGASAVLSTLWQIADDSTARLMADFYDGLINRGLDKAQALRRAQIAMIRGRASPDVAQSSRAMSVVEDAGAEAAFDLPPASHPYYWAAFTLMGNWK
ncbi:MAG: CHAT domain-containing protein [Parvibaculaceae bacterium]